MILDDKDNDHKDIFTVKDIQDKDSDHLVEYTAHWVPVQWPMWGIYEISVSFMRHPLCFLHVTFLDERSVCK